MLARARLKNGGNASPHTMARVFVASLGQVVELKYLKVYRCRGKVFVYFRRKAMPEHRMDPESPSFMNEYESLLGERAPIIREGRDGTIDDLIIRFKKSPQFKQRAKKTKAQYTRDLDRLRERVGDMQASQMPAIFLHEWHDEMSDTPAAANAFIRSVKRLYNWAMKRGLVDKNPAGGIEMLKTGGYRSWEEYEIAAYREYWPLGTIERTIFELLYGTAQRISDVSKMEWRHICDGNIIVAAQQKTGQRVEVSLTKDVGSWPRYFRPSDREGRILRGTKGAPVEKRRYSEIFSDAVSATGLPDDLVAHGLRFSAAARLYDLGIGFDVIAMITGHRTATEAIKYATRREKTRKAIDKVDGAFSDESGAKVSSMDQKCLTPKNGEE